MKIRMKSIVLIVILGMVTMMLMSSASATISNNDIASIAIGYNGQYGDQCKVFVQTVVNEAAGENIVGYVPGANPKNSDKTIYLTAHYDHLGIGREIGGDSIYNGALDNGTALSMILCLAQEYGRNPEKMGAYYYGR